MKRKVLIARLIHPVNVSGALGSEATLSWDKQEGIQMYTGEEPGFLTIYRAGKCAATPIANCSTIVWENAPQDSIDPKKK